MNEIKECPRCCYPLRESPSLADEGIHGYDCDACDLEVLDGEFDKFEPEHFDVWGEIRSLINGLRGDPDRIDRLVWILLIHTRTWPTERASAAKWYAINALRTTFAGSVCLGDLVEWMCAPGQPDPAFRAALAWAIVGDPHRSPCLVSQSGIKAWPDANLGGWLISETHYRGHCHVQCRRRGNEHWKASRLLRR